MADAARDYHLLIVDDDAIDRRQYSKLLMRHTHGACEIREAGDGAAGLKALRDENPDCLLLDFSLPDMTGLEFLAGAAPEGELPCAIVLVTGQGNETIAVEAMKRGVQDYLVKTQVDEGRLWAAVVRAVTQTELRRRLAVSLLDLTAANGALAQEIVTRRAVEAELRGATQAAQAANAAKTRFVAMVTHELRTPLNGILGYAQLLRLEGGLSTRQDARVGSMMQAGQHLLGMVEGVLDFASIETGRMILHPAMVSVRDLTEGCIGAIGALASQNGLSLRLVHAHDAPVQIVADPGRLRQVLLNLLGNAVKYTKAGSVELRTLAGATRGGLRIEVADSGPGIEGASREKLFKDFERLDADASVEGAGLGLAIAARIVGLIGGVIGHSANLGNPGGGSIFWLELPPGETVLPAAAPDMPAHVAHGGRRVLLVDDIAMNRDVIGAFLRAAGQDVLLAETGQEAVRLAFEQSFDLILMDVRMPEMDGLEATRHIRALPGPRGRVPILALTAYTLIDQAAQCLDAGMDGFIAKPVDYDTMMRAIDDAVARAPPRWTPERARPGVVAPQDPPPPRFDRAVLDETLAFLPAGNIDATLQSLRDRKEDMVRLLGMEAAPSVLTEAAHALASTAGMFGFVSLAALARRYESAAAQDAPEAADLARALSAETRATIGVLDGLRRERRLQPA
jgi:signal transduction histidine kinase/HPt (histidine-containing phosphotransfer) domain-containing protein